MVLTGRWRIERCLTQRPSNTLIRRVQPFAIGRVRYILCISLYCGFCIFIQFITKYVNFKSVITLLNNFSEYDQIDIVTGQRGVPTTTMSEDTETVQGNLLHRMLNLLKILPLCTRNII